MECLCVEEEMYVFVSADKFMRVCQSEMFPQIIKLYSVILHIHYLTETIIKK